MPSPSPLAGEGKLSRSDSRERGRRISKFRGRAKDLRSESTEAEHRLWQLLRAHRFAGYKFRRQVPIDFYIADFVCFARRLIIELDGGQHTENTGDTRRDAFLKSQGLRVLCIWNNEFFNNEGGAAETILSALQSPPLPNPSPARGEGLVGDRNG